DFQAHIPFVVGGMPSRRGNLVRGVSCVLPGTAIQHVLQWLDLASHLRLRESSVYFKDEVPRLTTTLVIPGVHGAVRYHSGVFRFSPIRHLTLDFAQDGTRWGTRGPSTWFLRANDDDEDGGGESREGTSRRHDYRRPSDLHETLGCALRQYRPLDLRVLNMTHGRQFSDALSALEEQPGYVSENLCELDLRMAVGGPRPDQEAGIHAACMRRLGDLLSRRSLSGGVGGGSPSWRHLQKLRLSCDLGNGDLELLAEALTRSRALYKLSVLILEGHPHRAKCTDLITLAEALSPGSSSARTANTTTSANANTSDPTGRSSSVLGNASVVGSASDSNNSAGVTGRGANCVESLAATTATASTIATSGTSPIPYPALLTTLQLRHFRVVGSAGLTALGAALADGVRFPRFKDLSLDDCQLSDDQAKALAKVLPGMMTGGKGKGGWRLRNLSLRSNYALSREGIQALTRALGGSPDPSPDPGAVAQVPCSYPPHHHCPGAALESLDFSFSCWWLRQPTWVGLRRKQDDEEGGSSGPPLTLLLRALGEGCCPRLRSLGLAGCYFGDGEAVELASALGQEGLGGLRWLDVSGNLFGEIGVNHLSRALEEVPKRLLTMQVLGRQEPKPRELCTRGWLGTGRCGRGSVVENGPGEGLHDVLARWLRYQELMLRTVVI
ncbi:unnamed protein product, partial [Discosporangium mesarthrocarpum]